MRGKEGVGLVIKILGLLRSIDLPKQVEKSNDSVVGSSFGVGCSLYLIGHLLGCPCLCQCQSLFVTAKVVVSIHSCSCFLV